jgi:hypothetical protein
MPLHTLRKYRTLLLVLCLAACMLALGGCSKIEEVRDTLDPASKLDVDYGMTVIDADAPDLTIGIVVTNNSDKVATRLELELKPCDAEGEVISVKGAKEDEYKPATQIIEVPYVMPGEKAGALANDFFDVAEAPDHMDVTIKNVEWKDVSEIPEGDVTITDFSYTPGTDLAYASLKNTTGFTYDINDLLQQYWVNINIIGYDEDGKIVGGDFCSVQYLGPDSETSEEVYLDGKLSKTGAVTVEPYVQRIEFQPESGATYYDNNGKEYTAEEVEEYYKNKNQNQ